VFIDVSDPNSPKDVTEHKIADVIQTRVVKDPEQLGQKKCIESLDLSREIITHSPATFDSFVREKQHGVSKERFILRPVVRFILIGFKRN
jgi:hypothetical protein